MEKILIIFFVLTIVCAIILLVRNNMVYTFRTKMIDEDWEFYQQLPKYNQMVYSIKPLKKKYWMKEKPLIERIWYDNNSGNLYIHTNCRSGLFHLPADGNKKHSLWLCDFSKTKDLPKDQTIYKLMDVKEGEFKTQKTE